MSLDRSSSVPFYVQLKQTLQSEIQKGVYAPGELIPTEVELCKRYGISRHTVRQALSELVQEGIVYRVPGKGTFVARRRPRANIATDTITILLAGVTDHFTLHLLQGVEDVATAQRWTLTFGNSKNTHAEQARLIEEAVSAGSEGFIIMPVDPPNLPSAREYLSPFHTLSRLGIPVVFIDRFYDGVDFDAVVSDNYGGMLEAVTHLAELGHTSIGFVSTANFQTSSVSDRFKGYLAGLDKVGIRPTPSWVLEWKDGRERLMEYLQTAGPTAIVAVNDYIAAEVLVAARELGLKVPDDLAIVGFDDSDVATLVEVPLTTVRQFPLEMGKAAASRLLEILRGSRGRGPNRLVMPTELIIRESTGVHRQAG